MIWNYDNAYDSLRRMLTKLDDMSYSFSESYPELSVVLDDTHSLIRKASRMIAMRMDRQEDG